MEKVRTGLGSAGFSDKDVRRDSTSINKPEVQVVSNEQATSNRVKTEPTMGNSPIKAIGK